MKRFVNAGKKNVLLFFSSFVRFLFVALEGDECKGKGKGTGPPQDGTGGEGEATKERGLSRAIKDLFAGRLMNYIEVTRGTLGWICCWNRYLSFLVRTLTDTRAGSYFRSDVFMARVVKTMIYTSKHMSRSVDGGASRSSFVRAQR